MINHYEINPFKFFKQYFSGNCIRRLGEYFYGTILVKRQKEFNHSVTVLFDATRYFMGKEIKQDLTYWTVAIKQFGTKGLGKRLSVSPIHIPMIEKDNMNVLWHFNIVK